MCRHRAVAAYQYNGLHWRTRSLGWPGASERSARERVYTYNAAWQAIVEEIDDDLDTSGGESYTPRPERVVQQIFGLHGVNDALYRRTAQLPGGISYDGSATVDAADFFGNSIYQLADAQGSIVAVVAAGVYAAPVEGSSPLEIAPGTILESLEYDPYGRSKHIGIADFNRDGDTTIEDFATMASRTSRRWRGRGATAHRPHPRPTRTWMGPPTTTTSRCSRRSGILGSWRPMR